MTTGELEGPGSYVPVTCTATTVGQVPFRDHRRNWDHTRVQAPYGSGRYRHWQPVLSDVQDAVDDRAQIRMLRTRLSRA